MVLRGAKEAEGETALLEVMGSVSPIKACENWEYESLWSIYTKSGN